MRRSGSPRRCIWSSPRSYDLLVSPSLFRSKKKENKTNKSFAITCCSNQSPDKISVVQWCLMYLIKLHRNELVLYLASSLTLKPQHRGVLNRNLAADLSHFVLENTHSPEIERERETRSRSCSFLPSKPSIYNCNDHWLPKSQSVFSALWSNLSLLFCFARSFSLSFSFLPHAFTFFLALFRCVLASL